VQVLLTLLAVAASIPVTRRLHDAVPSAIRAGVASGVSTLTWLAFVPFALVVGVVSERAGIDRAGWLFVAVGGAAAVLMLVVLPRTRPALPEPAVAAGPAPAIDAGAFPPDRFLPPDDPDWPGHWATPPAAWTALGMPVDSPDTLEQARAAIADLPAGMRRVLVLRDIMGQSPTDVGQALNLSSAEQRALLQQARGLVRARLDQHFEGAGATR
jgi:hypothetical protein